MPKAATAIKTEYDVHPGLDYARNVLAAVEKRTGKPWEQWVDIAKKKGPKTEEAKREWLKTEHGFGTNVAGWIAEMAHDKGREGIDPDAYLAAAAGYVDTMFSGKKAGLRSIYVALVKLGRSVGADVKVCPCQTIVPFYRNHVFAQIKPATQTRIDFGYALGDMKPEGRLVDTGGFAKKNRITHCIPITSVDEIDAEVKRWLKVAYEKDK
ncbi:MAG: DUF5655 domain-containing protein [bacterium]